MGRRRSVRGVPGALRDRGGRRPRHAPSSRPSSPSATPATSAPATAATCSSPTSRKARAACAISRPCSGSAASSTGIERPAELVEHGVLDAWALRKFTKARRFLWAVRCHLHYLSDRAEERLTFDLQPEIARRMGYRDHKGVEQRRALHEALLPDRQGGRRADPDLLRRARGAAPAPAAPRARPVRLRAAPDRRHGDPGRSDRPRRARSVRARAAGHAPSVPPGPGAGARHSPPGAARGHPEPAADRARRARGPGGERPVHGHAHLAQGSRHHAAPDERGRPARPVPAGVRPRGRPDGAQPLPRLHGRRAHHPGDRRCCIRSRTAWSSTSCRSPPA